MRRIPKDSIVARDAERRLEQAQLAGFVSAGTSLLFAIVLVGGHSRVSLSIALPFADAVVTFALAIGVGRGSRVCALALLLLAAAGFAHAWWLGLPPIVLAPPILFGWFYGRVLVSAMSDRRMARARSPEE